MFLEIVEGVLVTVVETVMLVLKSAIWVDRVTGHKGGLPGWIHSESLPNTVQINLNPFTLFYWV